MNPATTEQRALIASCLDNGVPFYWRGAGTLLIARDGLPLVLQQVAKQGFDILGFEGFDVDPAIHPRLDLIFDAVRATPTVDWHSVIAGWPNDVWVDVTLHSP